jgi:hypothetical protein
MRGRGLSKTPRSFWADLSPLVLVAAVACSTGFPSPGNAEVAALKARDPAVRLEDLERGRSLYLAKCSGCHLVIEPRKFAADAWPEKIQRMQNERRVHLAPDELSDIERYVVATSRVARR